MFTQYYRACLCALIVLVSRAALADQFQWQLATEENGVKVYLAEQDGYEIQRFKATVEVSGTVDKVFKLFQEIENYPAWLADCREAKQLEEISKTQNVAHLIFESPWPVEDREVVFERSISGSPNTFLKLDFKASTKWPIESPCCVQIVEAEGFFLVEPTKQAGKTKVSYEFVSDPGGHIPDWLVNTLLTASPLNTLLAVSNSLN